MPQALPSLIAPLMTNKSPRGPRPVPTDDWNPILLDQLMLLVQNPLSYILHYGIIKAQTNQDPQYNEYIKEIDVLPDYTLYTIGCGFCGEG